MVRQSAIQRKRDDVRFEIEQTERGLQELLSLNESILLEITEMESDFVLSDAMDTGTNSDASLSAAASFSSSEELRSVNVINGTVNRSSSPETVPVDSWLSQFWPESSQVSDDWSDLLDRLRTLRSDHFRMNYSLIQALHDHLEMLLRKEEELAAQRYANRAKRYAGRGPGHGLMRCLDHVDRNDRDHDFFLTNIRMSKKAFDELYKVIKDHAVFKSRGRKPQTSPRIQLAVALWRFGGYGNRASAKGAVQWSGCSIGSVLKFTDRVMVALNEPIGGPMRTTTRRGTKDNVSVSELRNERNPGLGLPGPCPHAPVFSSTWHPADLHDLLRVPSLIPPLLYHLHLHAQPILIKTWPTSLHLMSPLLMRTFEMGLDELKTKFADERASFAYARITYSNDKESTGDKFIFITYIGSGVRVMRKAKTSVHKSEVQKALRAFSIEVQAENEDDLDEGPIVTRLRKAGGASYDRA
ncbi:hypothetical protein MVLG_01470 [Microbotryum lychnidis-dioicae p1A1 Lamole]|uniref:ADF-H domain-containing protein n=1 Tax=Microbotryum lychnidis-dioicae (strain p1A1 Lamole / MvSl-1064) TaxID=683840 RepID=U5H280_USTV1|nr:hypothetical protein MVLG_01470 [Microbotryum lychnidis-dioicae p1A1 Lamole]|eukprot:KDE08435.1 hypothetical protein MVLG_01470 [Microbotryum lychnidis-dioicae p1A1 Lamole]